MPTGAFGRGRSFEGPASGSKTGGCMHYRNDDTMGEPSPNKGRSSRRHFLSQLAALSASLTIAAPAARAASSTERSRPETPDSEQPESLVDILLKVNLHQKPLNADSRAPIL